MKLAIGSDERTSVTDSIVADLRQGGHELTLYGALGEGETAWPAVARGVAEAVAAKQAHEGVLMCWTGTGVSIAANKVPGIRAALCVDSETAQGARMWNDANILCLSLRLTSPAVAKEILDAWFQTTYQANPEDDACLAQVDALERQYRRAG
jgi:ribose 5-phosphate isomerase B